MLLLHILPLAIVIVAQSADDLLVSTQSGPVKGHYVPGKPTVREFLGIPYGAPPVGDLRWAPAIQPPRWNTPLEAKAFSPACYNVVPTGYNLGASPTIVNTPKPLAEDEDCLSLNVWAPTAARLKYGGAAVMLWMHGGAFARGGTFIPVYNGANIVRDQEDIILVTFNYRLGIFGFPGASVFGNKANPALHDVRSAIEWVRDNIASFGGDPKKITLFGFSAGGTATEIYLYSHEKDPIIHAAIIESSTITIRQQNKTVATGEWNKLAAGANCTHTSDYEQLACLRAIPASRIREVANVNKLSFIPGPDGGPFKTDNEVRLRSGRFSHIPLLVGNNNEEIQTPGIGVADTQGIFTCTSARSARFHAHYGKTWQYRYFGNFPVGNWTNPGAYHGSEVEQVFGTYLEKSATDFQRKSSRYMQAVWTAFAKDPINGLSRLGLPTYNAQRKTLIRLAYENVPGATLVRPGEYEDGCDL